MLRIRALAICLLALAAGFAPRAAAGPIEDRLAESLAGLDPAELETGVLYDRVLPLSGIERFDGRRGSPAASARLWRQLYDELRRAAADPAARPDPEGVMARGRRSDAVPIALVFDRYERMRPDALESGAVSVRRDRLVRGHGALYQVKTAFAAAALREATYRGAEVSFVLDRSAFFSNTGLALAGLELDLGDGRGFRRAAFDVPVRARYAETGTKLVRVRAEAGGEALEASFAFVVRALAAPLPDDTLHVTGTVPYLGGVAGGDAYVYLAPGRTALLNPVVVVEGFDLDNSMNWDELYALLDQESLLENLRAEGFDAVVLNFTDATDYLQRNAFVVVELLEELRAQLAPQSTLALAGASMGGLVSRYALTWMEANARPHSVRTFLSFDAPHLGADIPLGIQYWMKFFSTQSADAAYLLSRLDRPAARQMLVYHYTDPAGTTGQPDPLRGAFVSDLAALGDYPALPLRVAIANGSGAGLGQGFTAGAQIIQWSYSDLFVAITGNVWAVPNAASTKIFDGRLRILFSTTTQAVTVSGTQPYDNAPGGSRATMTQMDTTAAPYGDIVALYPSHCFIPTVSALAYDTPDLFHDISQDPDPLAHTPFQVVHAPAVNQEHVTITPENAAWFDYYVGLGVIGVGPVTGAPGLELRAPAPNPTSGRARIAYSLARAGEVDLRVMSVDGREVARLARGWQAAGPHQVSWDGTSRDGRQAASGIYFVRLEANGRAETRRLVRFR